MHCSAEAQYVKRRRSARLIAALICVCFVLALVLSSAFIVTHSSHEHDSDGVDGGCAVCAHIVAAENLLKAVTVSAALCAIALGALIKALSVLHSARRGTCGNTPIGLKVRLNN